MTNNSDVQETALGVIKSTEATSVTAIESGIPKRKRFGRIQDKLKTAFDKLKIGYP